MRAVNCSERLINCKVLLDTKMLSTLARVPYYLCFPRCFFLYIEQSKSDFRFPAVKLFRKMLKEQNIVEVLFGKRKENGAISIILTKPCQKSELQRNQLKFRKVSVYINLNPFNFIF